MKKQEEFKKEHFSVGRAIRADKEEGCGKLAYTLQDDAVKTFMNPGMTRGNLFEHKVRKWIHDEGDIPEEWKKGLPDPKNIIDEQLEVSITVDGVKTRGFLDLLAKKAGKGWVIDLKTALDKKHVPYYEDQVAYYNLALKLSGGELLYLHEDEIEIVDSWKEAKVGQYIRTRTKDPTTDDRFYIRKKTGLYCLDTRDMADNVESMDIRGPVHIVRYSTTRVIVRKVKTKTDLKNAWDNMLGAEPTKCQFCKLCPIRGQCELWVGSDETIEEIVSLQVEMNRLGIEQETLKEALKQHMREQGETKKSFPLLDGSLVTVFPQTTVNTPETPAFKLLQKALTKAKEAIKAFIDRYGKKEETGKLTVAVRLPKEKKEKRKI